MKRIFTYFFFAFAVLLTINEANGQGSCTNAAIGSGSSATCGQQVTEDFEPAGPLYGFSGDPMPTNPSGALEQTPTGTQQAGAASITTNTLLVPFNAANATIRFNTSGADVTTFDVYVITSGNPFGTLICDNVAITTINGNSQLACLTVNLSAYQDQRIKLRFDFTTTGVQKFFFDNFGTNLAPAAIALPVNFHAFEARKLNAGTQLTWKVGQEQNLSHYEIEKSNTGRGYTSIGTVQATGASIYNFTDQQASGSQVFYRIKSVDQDGKFKYSPIVTLRNGKAAIALKVFPLPARNNVTVEHESIQTNGLITISTADGRIVKSIQPARGTMQTEVMLADIKAGMYLLRFDNGNGQVETIKLIKQ